MLNKMLRNKFYRSLYRIRRVEEEIARIYPSDKIKSPIHLSIGQEAVSVGVCEALAASDVVFGTYRGHALYLAKGGSLKRMIAELYGKATGCAKGKGGSMHLVDRSAGMMVASAVVGTTISQAVGYAFAQKILGQDVVVASFFGDGAVEEGSFHESLNFASLKKVPILFICENNQYAIHSPLKQRQPLNNLCERVRAYGIQAEKIEENDLVKIYERVKKGIAKIRKHNGGPLFFECMTYRWKEHVGPNDDFDAGYRSLQEAKWWFENDPLKILSNELELPTREKIEAEVEAEIAEAFDYAEQSDFPRDSELYDDVYEEPAWSA